MLGWAAWHELSGPLFLPVGAFRFAPRHSVHKGQKFPPVSPRKVESFFFFFPSSQDCPALLKVNNETAATRVEATFIKMSETEYIIQVTPCASLLRCWCSTAPRK